jgi:uncharacterized protein DUF2809
MPFVKNHPILANFIIYYLLCNAKYFYIAMVTFNKCYFLLMLLLLCIELYIGIYMHDSMIRPYGGDFFVVILLYCLIKSFIDLPVLLTAAWVLIFAYAVEVSQYFHLINLLGLQNSKIATILMGTSFSFIDLGTYTLGILLVVLTENLRHSLKNF